MQRQILPSVTSQLWNQYATVTKEEKATFSFMYTFNIYFLAVLIC